VGTGRDRLADVVMRYLARHGETRINDVADALEAPCDRVVADVGWLWQRGRVNICGVGAAART